MTKRTFRSAVSHSYASKQPYYGSYIPSRPCRCGKSGYTSRQEARAVVREMRRKDASNIDRLDIYRCREDDTHWHLGHDSSPQAPNLNDPASWGVEPRHG